MKTMRTMRLGDGAELCLSKMNLSEDKTEKVRQCISRYSLPHTFDEAIRWVVYRVTNLFFACVGVKTDWEFAKQMIKDRFMEIESVHKVYSIGAESKQGKCLREGVIRVINNSAEFYLNYFLNAQNKHWPIDEIQVKNLKPIEEFGFRFNYETKKMLKEMGEQGKLTQDFLSEISPELLT